MKLARLIRLAALAVALPCSGETRVAETNCWTGGTSCLSPSGADGIYRAPKGKKFESVPDGEVRVESFLCGERPLGEGTLRLVFAIIRRDETDQYLDL